MRGLVPSVRPATAAAHRVTSHVGPSPGLLERPSMPGGLMTARERPLCD